MRSAALVTLGPATVDRLELSTGGRALRNGCVCRGSWSENGRAVETASKRAPQCVGGTCQICAAL